MSFARKKAAVWELARLFALLCAVSLSGVAAADDSGEPRGYRELIEQAVTEYDAQNYLEARSLFARAHRLYPNARTLRGLGAVSFELRMYTESVRYLESALAAREKALEGARWSEAQRLLERARGFVATIDLDLRPRSAEIRVDGKRLERGGPQLILLDLGQHKLTFHADGYADQERSYTVEGGERIDLSVSLERADESGGETQAEQGSPERGAAPGRSLKPWKFAALGTGIATLALTAGAVGMREKYARELQRTCEKYTTHCRGLIDKGESWKYVAIGAGTVSALLAATTIALFALDESKETPAARALRACSPGVSPLSVRCGFAF